jgi:exonuclease SbcD
MFTGYDWHIGSALYGRKRYEEFEAFLNWLAVLIHGIANREVD